MKIYIVGLGLMGASYAEELTLKGHQVYGYDQDEKINELAIQEGLILGTDFSHLATADLLILALYPEENIHFIETHLKQLKPHTLITDISGTKRQVVTAIETLLPENIPYISHHPMAGKEQSGYSFKDPTMFKNANFIVIRTKHFNEKQFTKIKTIHHDLAFGKMLITSPEEHDQFVAFTSQLTHLIAVSLMQTEPSDQFVQATGDSFRDLTRIAKINEKLWAELFLDNQDALIQKTDAFIRELHHLKQLIIERKTEAIETYLKEAKERRKKFDEINNPRL